MTMRSSACMQSFLKLEPVYLEEPTSFKNEHPFLRLELVRGEDMTRPEERPRYCFLFFTPNATAFRLMKSNRKKQNMASREGNCRCIHR